MSSPARSMLLEIRHVTGFNYAGAADSSYNEARMTPATLARQRVVAASLDVRPRAVQSTYRDYFDTVVTTFDLHVPHQRLEVVAEAVVETIEEPVPDLDMPVAALADDAVRDRFAEYLTPTSRTTMSPSVTADLVDHLAGLTTVGRVAEATASWVRERVDYVRGVTEVSSTAQEVWDQRQGVCQDLTHVTVALLRSVGVPARYVSGYLHPLADPVVGERVLGESHAWVEYYAGAWVGIDPTNLDRVGVRHVIVARGREYGDVPPLKGIYHGGPSSALGVSVEITRLG